MLTVLRSLTQVMVSNWRFCKLFFDNSQWSIWYQKVKERVTINACSNASGSIKLPLLFIGKAKNLRCFRGIDKSTLPVVYRSQKNAWINTVIFNDWFQNCFVPDVKKKLTEIGQEPKALLLLDNCSAHPNEDELASSDGLIVAKFYHQMSRRWYNPWIRVF